MGLGNKPEKFDFGDNDEATAAKGDSFGSVACSICLEAVTKDGDRAWANLQCGHQFHLDCIGSAFNAKGEMQCPNCRKVEKGQWLFANGCHSFPEYNVDDWNHEDTFDMGGYSDMSFVHWCPFGASVRLEDGEFPPSSYQDLMDPYFVEPAASTGGHPCPYVTYFGPVHLSSSSIGGVADSSSFSSHWNTASSGEVPAPFGFPVEPHYHGWEYHSPPPPPPQHLSASGTQVGSPTHPTPPSAPARTSRGLRPRPPHFMRPFHGHSSSGRAGSSVASVPRAPPFPGSIARTRDRTQALQAYYQQSPAQSNQQPVFPSGQRSGRGITSGMGSTSSSSDQASGSGFTRFNIWERDPYIQSQQVYPVNQMGTEPSIWSSSFNEGSGNFHQRVGGGGGGSS